MNPNFSEDGDAAESRELTLDEQLEKAFFPEIQLREHDKDHDKSDIRVDSAV